MKCNLSIRKFTDLYGEYVMGCFRSLYCALRLVNNGVNVYILD